jgi:hypothetical protein
VRAFSTSVVVCLLVVIAAVVVDRGTKTAAAADACASRDPFGPSFSTAWNDQWGGLDVGVAVEDHLTGCVYTFGDPDEQFPEASVVKIQIMDGVLLGVQQGSWTLDSVWGQLVPMITESDENAAEALWAQIGSYDGMGSVAQAFGLGDTYDAATTGGNLSTASDVVKLVDETIGTAPSPLTDDSRAVARSLMTGIDPTEAWGVSAGVPGGWTVGLKNGWYLTQPTDIGPAGLWRINSAGMVWDDSGRDRWSVAVLGNEWSSYGDGIAAVEAIASQVSTSLSPEPEATVVPTAVPTLEEAEPPAAFVPVTPTRALDTRTRGTPVPGGEAAAVELAGFVPNGATSAMVHITVDRAAADGYLTVFRCGTAVPLASNLDYGAGTPASVDAVAPLAGTSMCVYTSATTDLVVDVSGAFTAAGKGLRFTPAQIPTRLVDTRTGGATVAAGSVTRVAVPAPSGPKAGAVMVDVTAAGATAPGFLAAYSCDGPQPSTSTLNYGAEQPVASDAVVPLGSSGTLCIYASAPVGIVVDLTGTFSAAPAGLLLHVAEPVRLLDTRAGTGGWLGVQGRDQTLTMATGLSPGSVAVVSLTAVQPREQGYETLWSGTTGTPLASSLNFAPGAIVANLAATRVGAGGTVAAHTDAGTNHLVIDLMAWYGP